MFAGRLACCSCQEWCPQGATWYFGFEGPTFNGYNKHIYVGDSVLWGQLSQKILNETHYFTWSPTPQYFTYTTLDLTRTEDGVLYLWHGQGGFYPPYWDTLAWFGAAPGDYWRVLQPEDFGCDCQFTVLDTGHADLSGLSLRYVNTAVEGSDCPSYPQTFIERIGSLQGIFFGECGYGWPDTTMRCYADIDMNYTTGIVSSCDLISGMQELASLAPFTLTQDPASDALELRFFSPTTSELRLILLDMSSRAHEEASISRGTTVHRISTTGLASGMFVVRVCDAGSGRWAVKWVKE